MTILEGVALGLLQGLAEFLPISSSGHLLVAKRLFGLSEVPLLFDIALHLATLGAVCLFFRKRIAELCVTLWRFLARKSDGTDNENLRTIAALLVATFFTGVLGMVIEKFLPQENIKFVSACFIVTAAMLVVSEFLGKKRGETGTSAPTMVQALVIGVAQGIGVLPGISRSGATISGALGSGLRRDKAGEFSFLLSIPAILGAFILELKDADTLMAQVSPAPLCAGMAVAFATGLAALSLFMGLVKRGKLSWFAVYLVPLGILGLLFL